TVVSNRVHLVAQIVSLLCRRIAFCESLTASRGARILSHLPIAYPRYSRLTICATTLGVVLLLAATGFSSSADHLLLAGRWRFELDRTNSGIQQRWFERRFSNELILPGSLSTQGIGDEISLQTKWTGEIVDESWFTAPEYAKYRQPGNIKIPFWLQPDK